jgi:hypothetical protein
MINKLRPLIRLTSLIDLSGLRLDLLHKTSLIEAYREMSERPFPRRAPATHEMHYTNGRSPRKRLARKKPKSLRTTQLSVTNQIGSQACCRVYAMNGHQFIA